MRILNSSSLALLLAPAVVAASTGSLPTVQELLREPDPIAYFGDGGSERPLPIRRARNLSSSAFTRLIARGVPVLVEDIMDAGFDKMREWNCEWVAKHFGGGRMQMSYMDDSNNQDVGDSSWHTNQQDNGLAADVVASGTPEFRPFYWDIKAMRDEQDRPGGWGADWPKIESAVKRATVTPSFMAPANRMELQHSPEFWFNPPRAGAQAHMDEHCIPTMAVQLSGSRKWRLGEVPRQQWGRSVESMYFDGHVYMQHREHGFITHDRKLWTPLFDVPIEPGQGLFFPPGFIHETKNTGEGCAASVTYQFPIPAPAIYWRTFLPRISRTGDMAACWHAIASLAGAGRVPLVEADVAPAWEAASARFRQLDADGDGRVTGTELERAYGAEEQRSGHRYAGTHHYSGASAQARDTMLYHDEDEDGIMSAGEFQRGYAAWSVNQARVQRERIVYWSRPEGQPTPEFARFVPGGPVDGGDEGGRAAGTGGAREEEEQEEQEEDEEERRDDGDEEDEL
eukprot:g5662.t1